jgi:hypothetical protein
MCLTLWEHYSIPSVKGIYVVVSVKKPQEKFLIPGTGGFFRGQDPNVSKNCLVQNWVRGTHILYIGKTGVDSGITKATLKKRISAYLRFGLGHNANHQGGRYIWQLKNNKDLLIYWRVCIDGEIPRSLEKSLLLEFESYYNRLPFANLKH